MGPAEWEDRFHELAQSGPPRHSSEPWVAEIEATSVSWYWLIKVRQGALQWGPDGLPFDCFGSLRRAQKKARRLLAKAERIHGRKFSTTIYSE